MEPRQRALQVVLDWTADRPDLARLPVAPLDALPLLDLIERAIAAAVREERAECAQVAEAVLRQAGGRPHHWEGLAAYQAAAGEILAAIRRRGLP